MRRIRENKLWEGVDKVVVGVGRVLRCSSAALARFSTLARNWTPYSEQGLITYQSRGSESRKSS